MKRILVALDTTDNSSFVLARAIELATALGGKLRLLSAVQMPPIVPTPLPGPIYIDPAALVTGAEAMLREREREVPPALQDGFVVQVGTASNVICSTARSCDADLVVIGAHRHGLLARMLGTTAATIVNHIDRPVIVVRPTPGRREAQPEGSRSRAGAILRRDQERLEKTCESLVAAYRSSEWEAVRVQWELFEHAIATHIDTEEYDVLPELRTVDPDEADALLADHAELRRLLGALGVAIDLHAAPGRNAEELLACLRSHGAREELHLYPWMDEALHASKLRRLSPSES